MLRPKNKGVGPEPCFMAGCLSHGGSLKQLIKCSNVPHNKHLSLLFYFVSFSRLLFLGTHNRILTVTVTLSYSWRTLHKILCSKETFQIFSANQSLKPRPFKFLPAFRSIVIHRYEGNFDPLHFSQLITRFRTTDQSKSNAVISLVRILIVLEYEGALESWKKLKWSQPECLHQLKELNSI